MEAEMNALTNAKDVVEEENIVLKKKDTCDDKIAKYNKFTKENLGTTNPTLLYPFYTLPPPPNPPADPVEPTGE